MFYKFLLNIGLTPNKSKTLGALKIPDKFFFSFLRGLFDGDGYTYSYFDSRWPNSFMLYLGFCSASEVFIEWLQKEIKNKTGVKGSIFSGSKTSNLILLRYAKKESLVLIKLMYKDKSPYLERKKLKIDKALAILDKVNLARVEKMVNSLA